LYNVDQNKLYFSDPNTATWVEEVIQGYNMVNLNNCQTLGVFNEAQQQQAAVADNNQQAGNGIASDNTDATPVDDNVSAPAAPPALPDYEQPECPEDGYLWQPGYWAYNTDAGNYYWVPGVWVAPPQVGFLWTPPYWGYVGGVYAFHAGYWGNTIGFYGGVAYGFGYEGIGFAGGDWYGGHFRYNTAVVRVSTNVHNTFADARVVNRAGMRNHNSFNGPGGINARPTANELKAEHEHHVMVTPEQVRNQRAARSDRMQAAGAGGKPGNLANQKAPERVVTTGNRGGGGVGNGARNSNQAGMGRPGNSNQNAAVRPGGQGNGVRPGGPGNGAAPGQQGNGVRPGGPGAAQAQQGNGARPGAPGAGVRQGTPTAGNRPGAPTGNARQGSPAGNAKPAKTVNKPMSNSKPKNKN